MALWIWPQSYRQPLVEIAREAERLAQTAPEQIWLPWRPTAQVVTTGAHFHDEDGLHVRYLVNLPPSPDHLRQGLPANWHATALERASLRWGTVEQIWRFETKERLGLWDLYLKPSPAGP